ncbi:C-terminal helicase domain-containing protein [Brevibacillus laterosporus]|uniref:C-terminal helicase domain-containing protein n=1 Tax=Brevibacillus laterosporus TaxID=1465 RepID=UPI001F302C99|nr:C-terminal helicase domain-containing protein [Brevibacillus laterosporus]
MSLKAGGVGLNLTRANHVIHLIVGGTLPVENQATDRAYRIGQKKNVHVHRLICQGTLEERIDQLMERNGNWQNRSFILGTVDYRVICK